MHPRRDLGRALGPSIDVIGEHHHRLVRTHPNLVAIQVRRELTCFERTQRRCFLQRNRRSPVHSVANARGDDEPAQR